MINFFKNLRLSVKLIFKVRIEIIGQKEVNHHMTLLACESLPEGHKLQEDSNSWDFNEFGSCGKGKNIHLYNWALDADGIQFENWIVICLFFIFLGLLSTVSPQLV